MSKESDLCFSDPSTGQCPLKLLEFVSQHAFLLLVIAAGLSLLASHLPLLDTGLDEVEAAWMVAQHRVHLRVVACCSTSWTRSW